MHTAIGFQRKQDVENPINVGFCANQREVVYVNSR